MTTLINVLVSALLIAFASWLAGRAPRLAGFIVALPLSTLIVLPMSLEQHGDPEKTMTFARSIFVAIPISLLFFLPFLAAKRLELGFWTCYAAGLSLICLGYFLHRVLAR